MSADPSAHRLAVVAAQRHDATVAKAIAALRHYENSGEPITYAKLAAAAGVSRAWLYTQPQIRAALDKLRQLNNHSTRDAVPTQQRASTASLLRRLEAAHQRNRDLSKQVADLREQLAAAHGALREARAGSGRGRPASAIPVALTP